jgi:hypothetical protein
MEVLPLQQATQQLSLTGRRLQIAAVLLFEKNFLRLKRRCRGAAGRYNVLAYVVPIAVVIKTELEVQDNRLCNALTLSDLPDSDEVSLPCAGKV